MTVDQSWFDEWRAGNREYEAVLVTGERVTGKLLTKVVSDAIEIAIPPNGEKVLVYRHAIAMLREVRENPVRPSD